MPAPKRKKVGLPAGYASTSEILKARSPGASYLNDTSLHGGNSAHIASVSKVHPQQHSMSRNPRGIGVGPYTVQGKSSQ